MSEYVDVLAGGSGDYSWTISASDLDDGLSVRFALFRDGVRIRRSGFSGVIRPGRLASQWRGTATGQPSAVASVMDPRIDRAITETDRGARVDLVVSPVHEQFGVVFAGALLPEGHEAITTELFDGELSAGTVDQPTHHLPPSDSAPGAGWIAST